MLDMESTIDAQYSVAILQQLGADLFYSVIWILKIQIPKYYRQCFDV